MNDTAREQDHIKRDLKRIELALADIKQAEEILSLIVKTDDIRIRDNLWEYFVVVYCRPFTTSNIGGTESKMLIQGLCPESYTKNINHRNLMKCRMNITAHTSYDYSNVKIIEVSSTNGQLDVLVSRAKIAPMREVCKPPLLKDMLRNLRIVLKQKQREIVDDAISRNLLNIVVR